MPTVKFPKIKTNAQYSQFFNRPKQYKTAIIYCEGQFGRVDGKTANGLIRHSEKYKILSVIDSTKAELDSGLVLDDIPNNIPVCRDLTKALEKAGDMPDSFIFGMAPLKRHAIRA